MSDSEKKTLIGDLVLQYTRAKGEREMLRQKLLRCGGELKRFAELSTGAFESAQIEIDPTCSAEFGLQQIQSLIAKYRTGPAPALTPW